MSYILKSFCVVFVLLISRDLLDLYVVLYCPYLLSGFKSTARW